VAGDKITLRGLPPGRYTLKIYHTWRGKFIQESTINSSNGSVEFFIPRLFGADSHANYIGQDAAFILEAGK
jgi:hypothetical protein